MTMAPLALSLPVQLGTIEKDKLADLLIVEGNLFQDVSALRKVVVVVKDGTVLVDNR
jgi:imidazolonepropionase-like amidohydrolase